MTTWRDKFALYEDIIKRTTDAIARGERKTDPAGAREEAQRTLLELKDQWDAHGKPDLDSEFQR